jgi:hypothetical protein
MSLDHNDVPSPFDRSTFNSCQERFQDRQRYALQRLVETGIIPVYIYDGGISMDKLNDWGLQWTFPWIKLPWFVQAKRRAYFEFIIPVCHRTEFVQMCLVLNGHWGHVELDAFVLYAAQEAKSQTKFRIGKVWKATQDELKRCGVPTNFFSKDPGESDDEKRGWSSTWISVILLGASLVVAIIGRWDELRIQH